MGDTSRFGLHMGNSTISLSILKEGKVEIVASKFGDRSSFACLAVTTEGEYCIGLPAKQGIARNESLTIINNFQFLNENLSEEDIKTAATSSCLCKVNTNPLEYHLAKGEEFSKTVTPYQAAVHLLKNSYENATYAAKSESSLEVVLAVPIHWSKKSRQRLCKAASESGFNILQVLSEPSAALLAYDIGINIADSLNVAVVRLGGLSSDITILSVENGMYSVVDNLHLPRLGGNILTDALSDYLASEFLKKYKLDPKESRRTMVKLKQTAETCKHVLSTMPSSHVFIESLMDGIDWSQNISRARFENVIAPTLNLFVRPIEEFITKHNITIDKIIFAGGTMKIPKLQSAISALFPNAQVLNTISPDEVIAMGCAKQASFITGIGWDMDGEHIDMEITTLPQDIFVRTVVENDEEENNNKELLLKRGALVPSINSVSITKPIKCVDGKAKLCVIQGDHEDIVERQSNQDLIEISARVHGGTQQHYHAEQTVDKATIHIHLH